MFAELDQLLALEGLTPTPHADVLELHEGERREVAILFADIKGFTVMSERLDPEQVRMILDKLLQLFTVCIKQHGGYVDKYEGDLVMALFGAKVTSERDTERAILAALQMLAKLAQFNVLLARNPTAQGIELGVRIGINTGLVTTGRIGEKRAGDFTVYGDAVNLASRMESNAPVNRIMLPAETARIVSDTFEFEDYGEIQVKGKSKSVAVCLVKGVKTRPIQRWEVKKSVYVGRTRELSVLHEKFALVTNRLKHYAVGKLLNDSEQPKPIVIGLKGPAGLGKSRMVHEFLQSLGVNARVVSGSAPRITPHPYCVFTSLIRHALDISPLDTLPVIKTKLDPVTPDDRPLLGYLLGVKSDDVRLQLEGKELQPHLHAAIRHFLEATAGQANQTGLPLLVILEDLQWADEASQAALDFLMNTLNLEAKRQQQDFKHFLFLFTYRPEYAISRDVKIEADFLEIELQPLVASEAEQLLQALLPGRALPAEITQQVLAKAIGNPFYLEEWANLIQDLSGFENLTGLPVPKTLTALILSRIDQLEQDVKLLLQKAAVIGREFFVEILAAIEQKLQQSDDIARQLDHLETKDFVYRLLDAKYSAYFFKHVITQEVAYNTLLLANRKILHRLTAEVIEERFADHLEDFYYDLAEHYSKAEIEDKAFEYLKKAGAKAKANYDNQKALTFYDQVLALARRREDHATVIGYLLEKGGIFWLIGKWDEHQKRFYEEALCLAETIHHRKYITEVKRVLGRFYWLNGDPENAMRYLREAMTGFKTIHDQQGLGKIAMCMGNVYQELLGNYTKAIGCYQKAVHLFEEVNDKKEIAGATCNLGGVYVKRGDYDNALTCYQKALKMNAASGNDKFLLALSILGMGFTHHWKGDINAALTYYEQCLQTSQEMGSKWLTSLAIGRIGFAHGDKGNHHEAIACYDRAITIAKELHREYFLSIWLINKAEALFVLQKFEEAQAVNTQSIEIAEKVGSAEHVFRSNILSAKIDFASGKKEEALRCLSEMLTHTENEAEIARLHYELWKMEGHVAHQKIALKLYRKLYKKTPRFDYQNWIEELQKL